MLTLIRTSPNRIKYCGRTVDNLIQSNGDSDHEIVIVCSGDKTANDNGYETIRRGIELSNGKAFMFLEDDLNFIKHFGRAADEFTTHCEGVPSIVLPLCAAYDGVERCRGIAWRYPVSDFYGTQAFVIRPAEAVRFLAFIDSVRPLPSKGFDMLIKRWAESEKQTHFLTPYRSFVQHLGVESSIHNGRFHHYRSWPGTEWEYRSGVFPLSEQKHRPFDRPLAEAIARYFGIDRRAYDFGASVGLYVAALRAAGLNARGFDATPGIESDLVDEVDLARPQALNVPSGNVMSLEVAEHIHPVCEHDFLKNISSLCNDKLVLSWARRGQGGRGHVNTQDSDYVLPRLSDYGFTHDASQTSHLRKTATISWLKQNVYAFRKQR